MQENVSCVLTDNLSLSSLLNSDRFLLLMFTIYTLVTVIKCSPISETAMLFWKVPRLRPSVILVRATCRWRWNGALVAWFWHGKAEVLGEKNFSNVTLSTTIIIYNMDSTKHNSAGYTSTGEYRHNLIPHISMLPQHQSVTQKLAVSGNFG